MQALWNFTRRLQLPPPLTKDGIHTKLLLWLWHASITDHASFRVHVIMLLLLLVRVWISVW
jgi:hypothetical protein